MDRKELQQHGLNIKKEIDKHLKDKPDDFHCDEPYYVLSGNHFFRDCKVNVVLHYNFGVATYSHKHDFFELIYVNTGSIDSIIDNKHVRLKQGDLCLLNINALHTMPPIDHDTTIFNILIEKSLLNEVFFMLYSKEDTIYNFFLDSLYHTKNKNNYILFRNKDYGYTQYERILSDIIVEHMNKSQNYDRIIYLQVNQLFLILTREYQNIQDKKSKNETDKHSISHILSYIKDNYRNVSIQSTADYFHYHKTYVPQLLKKYTGKTFTEIVQNFKIETAKDLFRNSDMTIEQVTEYIGYSHSSYFYRVFKQETGMSPSQYRNQQKKPDSV